MLISISRRFLICALLAQFLSSQLIQAGDLPARANPQVKPRHPVRLIDHEDSKGVCSITYQTLEGSVYGRGEKSFNALMKKRADTINGCLDDDEMDHAGLGGEYYSDEKDELIIAFGRFVSVIIHSNGYTGGIHPNHGARLETFDLATGAATDTGNLFLPESDYEGFLFSQWRLCEEGKMFDYMKDQFVSRLRNGKLGMEVDEDGLRIVFPEVEDLAEAGHTDELHKCLLPYSILLPYLNPHGLLGKYIRFPKEHRDEAQIDSHAITACKDTITYEHAKENLSAEALQKLIDQECNIAKTDNGSAGVTKGKLKKSKSNKKGKNRNSGK